ncbi:unnamed protein product, partial [Rotaria magnacalcarata]
ALHRSLLVLATPIGLIHEHSFIYGEYNEICSLAN